MKNKIVAIQGNNLKTINPKSDTSIFPQKIVDFFGYPYLNKI